jgi:hypothetical protein
VNGILIIIIGKLEEKSIGLIVIENLTHPTGFKTATC